MYPNRNIEWNTLFFLLTAIILLISEVGQITFLFEPWTAVVSMTTVAGAFPFFIFFKIKNELGNNMWISVGLLCSVLSSPYLVIYVSAFYLPYYCLLVYEEPPREVYLICIVINALFDSEYHQYSLNRCFGISHLVLLWISNLCYLAGFMVLMIHGKEGYFSFCLTVSTGMFLNLFLSLNEARFQRTPLAQIIHVFNGLSFLVFRFVFYLGLNHPVWTRKVLLTMSWIFCFFYLFISRVYKDRHNLLTSEYRFVTT